MKSIMKNKNKEVGPASTRQGGFLKLIIILVVALLLMNYFHLTVTGILTYFHTSVSDIMAWVKGLFVSVVK